MISPTYAIAVHRCEDTSRAARRCRGQLNSGEHIILGVVGPVWAQNTVAGGATEVQRLAIGKGNVRRFVVWVKRGRPASPFGSGMPGFGTVIALRLGFKVWRCDWAVGLSTGGGGVEPPKTGGGLGTALN